MWGILNLDSIPDIYMSFEFIINQKYSNQNKFLKSKNKFEIKKIFYYQKLFLKSKVKFDGGINHE